MDKQLYYDDLPWKDGLDSQAIRLLLKEEAGKDRHKIVVLDDDPTGVQTVHDVPVYTDWSRESIRRGFLEQGKMFFLLTNSRSFSEDRTRQVHREIGQGLASVSQELGTGFVVVSRGDSTLRGHYPLETQVLKETLEACTGEEIHGEIICPFFSEGGRYTYGNVHYVKEGNRLIPAAMTEFAKDKTFGYRSSDLREYIEEKTKGTYKKENVACISTGQLRAMDLDGVEQQLMSVAGFGKVVVNALTPLDLKVFCIALYRAMGRGKRFLFRTAAGFVKEFAAVEDRGLLTGREVMGSGRAVMGKCSGAGGLILVGSHTQKTTAQLEALKEVPGIRLIEFDSDKVTDDAAVRLSEAVRQLAGRLRTAPGFIVAKGGITSSDVGTKALHVKRAWVLGQIGPGVPVWRTGPESRFPGIPYIIFPGNVGGDTTLRDVVEKLMG